MRYLVSGLLIIILLFLLIMLGFNIWIEKDYERCMNMPASEMFDDKSCSIYWGAE